MSTRQLRNPRVVGLVIAFVLGALTVGATSFTFLSFGKHTYTADFARSGGAKPGDEVRISGIGVGKIKSVKLAGDHVEIRFTVDDKVRLGKDTTAEVKLATLLGNKYLEIKPQGPSSLPGNRVPLRQTHVTFDVQDAIESGGSALGELDAHKIQQALSATADAFRGTPAAVRATLDGLGQVSEQLATRRDQLESLVTGASEVVSVLQARSGDLVNLMDHSDLLLREVLARRQALHELIIGTRTMAAELSGLVRDNAAEIRPFLDRLSAVTDLLSQRSKDLDAALKVIGPAVRYYVNVSGNGPFADAQLPYLAPDNALCLSGLIKGCR